VKNVDVKTNSTTVRIHFAINCASADMNLFLISSVTRFRSTLVKKLVSQIQCLMKLRCTS